MDACLIILKIINDKVIKDNTSLIQKRHSVTEIIFRFTTFNYFFIIFGIQFLI